MTEKYLDAITFEAYDVQIRTTRDGGYRLTLDLSESDHEAVSQFLKFNLVNQKFGVSVVPLKKDE